jgi:hypothetical protein
VSEVQVTSEYIREVARSTSYAEGSRRAFVASSDVQFGLSRMFQILSDESPAEVRVFRDLAEARRWLGLD